jgi:hypothetical protein
MYFPCIIKEVDEMCRAHPRLEFLHLDDSYVEYPFCMKADWVLHHLKTFVYVCLYPMKGSAFLIFILYPKLRNCKVALLFFFIFSEILEPFLKAAPNLEVLGIGLSNNTAFGPNPSPYDEPLITDFLKMISRCGRLTTITLNQFCLFEGDLFAVYAQD